MAMANKPKPDTSKSTGIRALSPVPEATMDHSGLPAQRTPEDKATTPVTLSPELLTAIASNPATAAAVAAAAAVLSPTATTAPTAAGPSPPTTTTATASAYLAPPPHSNPPPPATASAYLAPPHSIPPPPTRPTPTFSGSASSTVEPASRGYRFQEETSNWADEDVEMPSYSARSEPSILQKVAQAIDAKSKAMLPGQEVEKHGYDLLVLHDKQDMAAMQVAQEAAEQVTIRDCMPESERDATTSEEASQIANNAARPNMVEYVLVTISKNEAGKEDVSIPHPDVFVELTGAANYQLILENPNWGLVTDSCEPDAVGVGFISLNYQYREGAERYKRIIQSYSTAEMKVQLYPTTKHLNRCALSIYLHGQHYVPTERLASVIALCNQDTLRGEFTILNIKSLKTNKKVGARVLALDGSPEFLDSLSKTRKDHKFRLSNKRFYISGGVRLDSKSNQSAFPSLTPEQSTSILSRNLDKILQNAKKQQSDHANKRRPVPE